MDYSKVYIELKEAIKAYAPGLNAIALKSGLSYNTVKKAMDSNYKNGPNPETVYKICSVLTKKKGYKNVALSLGGEISQFLENSYPYYFEKENPKRNLDINQKVHESMSDFLSFIIITACGSKKGATIKDLEEIACLASANTLNVDPAAISEELNSALKKTYESKIEKLKGKEVIVQKDDTFFLNLEDNTDLNIDFNTMKSHLPNLLSLFKEKDLNKHKNLFYFYFEKINPKALNDILKIQYKASKDIIRVMSDPKSEGEIPYTSILFSETLLLSNNEIA